MYIKEVIIDGFKSYAQRTVISGFDPLFNAITGLNGSGKSNVLDSICFVLGISNLTQVRASNLQDLVYKQGQAGVNKASVTIIFDNTDKNQSPVGYEHIEEISVNRTVVIGGRNKYMINGINAQPGRVQNLFHSVQLNVNNPHFLIMQGRITKVLNMKPMEYLSMIEEAAGTRMFEKKKMESQRTIQKKEGKLSEINKVIEEDIRPTMDKLEAERADFRKFKSAQTEIGRLERFVVACNYMDAKRKLDESSHELEAIDAKIAEHNTTFSEAEQSCKEIGGKIAETQKLRDAEMGAEMKELEEKVNKTSKLLVKCTTAWNNKKETRQSEETALAAQQTSITEMEASIDSKKADIEKAKESFQHATEKFEEAEAEVVKQEKRCQAVALGMSTKAHNTESKTFAEQQLAAEDALAAAASEKTQLEMRLSHAKKELASQKGKRKEIEQKYKEQSKGLDRAKSDVANLEKTLGKINYCEKRVQELQQTIQQINFDITEQEDIVASLRSVLGRFEFLRQGVHVSGKIFGVVAKLITVQGSETASAATDPTTALEVTAGGRLYNVVVDNEQTATKLVGDKNLTKRVTIIPLSKIQATRANIKGAAAMAGDAVKLAVELVGYEDDVQKAMDYVFGNTFICSEEIAQKVAFGKFNSTKARAVTYKGDVYDPRGTVTGGSRQAGSVLQDLTRLQEASEKLGQLREQKKAAERELSELQHSASKYHKVKADLDLKQTQVSLLTTELEQSSTHQDMAGLKKLEDTIEECNTGLIAASKKEKDAKQVKKDIEKEMKEYDSMKDELESQANKQLKKAKGAISKARAAVEKAEEKVDELSMEAEALVAEIKTVKDQVKSTTIAIKELLDEESKLEDEVAKQNTLFKAAQESLEERKEKMQSYNDELVKMSAELARLGQAQADAQLEVQKMVHKNTRLLGAKKEAEKEVKQLRSHHKWIASEEQYFGVPDTAFAIKKDDPSHDPSLSRKRLATLKAQQEKLSKRINMKAQNMLDKATKEFNELLKKKKKVEDDKSEIEKTIEKLDEKKNRALELAYTQVNKDFGSIFSTLLPGTNAKLAPQEGMSVLEGLEVKVAFGDAWKESLNELSGGQRSLVALSLILSLLLFKPAPLYILDEVDAALDLSHTQNIGQMLRTHFNKSQFIVVSLKDGMFNNANVLFKTKFIDGVSTVKRYAQSPHVRALEPAAAAAASAGGDVEDKENQPQRSKAKSKAKGRSGRTQSSKALHA